jgi:LmeA-like phospholipid-binding
MRRFFIFLIILALILVAADRIAVRVAQRAIGQQIERSQNLSERPDVKVAGFPFLTQAIGGRYKQINADLVDLTVDGGLTIDKLDVQLNGVRIKASDAIAGRVSQAPVDSASALATVDYAALNAAVKANLPDDRLKVQLAEGKGDQLSITGTYRSTLISVKIEGQAAVQIQDGKVLVKLDPDSLGGLPTQVRSQVTSLLTGSYKLPPLPFGFKAKSVAVGPNGVTVRATTKAAVLG